MSLRIVHLSDLHISKIENYDLEHFILTPLKKDLLKFNESMNIDLVLITGDLIDKSGKTFNNMDEGFTYVKDRFIFPIIDSLKLNKSKVFFVPGNHDISRTADSEITEKGACSLLTSQQKVVEFMDKTNFNNYEAVERVLAYKNFEKEFYKDTSLDKKISIFESSFVLQLNGNKIGVACINSSWRSFSDNDKGKLIIGERQITHCLDHLDDCTIKILLSHHSYDHLMEFEKKSIDNLITENFNIALFGHNHSPETWAKSKMRGDLFTSVGRSNWTNNIRSENNSNCNGYSIIDYDDNLRQIDQHFRIYSHHLKEYVLDSVFVGDSGKISYKFSNEEINTSTLHNISKHIEDNFMATVDEDLLTFGSDTNAPSSINEIFVDPIIVQRTEDGDSDEKVIENEFLITEICKSKENRIIFGPKETGKTILLDKILLTYIDLINELQKIPIKIDFIDFNHSRIETSISLFTGIKITEIEQFLNDYDIVLLIDNIDFHLETKRKLMKFENFITKYPKVQIICTYLQSQTGQIPIEFTESFFYSVLTIMYLKYYKSKQITELTENWYSNVEMPNKKEKIERIIKLLLTLQLPRTPLAISMFLWIFEKQEEYQPINQATMLENFVEKLFKKHSKEESFYNEFNFGNKISLLSSIAKKMFFDSQDNYSIKYSRLLDFVAEHLNKRKFWFNVEPILDHFFNIGLLIKVNVNSEPIIRFRFNCFFQYFLMKNMENPEFFKYVMDEKHYLSFAEEIDYFTGLKQNRDDVLVTVVERMNLLFESLALELKKLPGGLDTFFNVKRSISEQIKEEDFFGSLECKKEKCEQDLIEIKDTMLETIKPDDKIEKKEFSIPIFNQLEKSWLLSAKLLRNTEETEDEEIKYSSFVSILKCSLNFLCLYRFLLVEKLRTRKDITEQQMEQAQITLMILPIIHETILSDSLSTTKLNLVLKEHLDSIKNNDHIPELEKLVSLLLYSDNRAKSYEKYIKDFVHSIKEKYIFDNLLLKVISYYFLRSHNKKSDLIFENLIADIIMKSKKISKKSKKSKIMLHFRNKRKLETKTTVSEK